MNLDDKELTITCPKCRQQLPIKIGHAKTSPDITCTGCSGVIHIKADQFAAEIAKVEKSFDDLKRQLAGIFKK